MVGLKCQYPDPQAESNQERKVSIDVIRYVGASYPIYVLEKLENNYVRTF